MKVKNKIGCLDKLAINFDSTCEIACKDCCITKENDELIKNLIELTKPNSLKDSKQSYASHAIGYKKNRPFFSYIAQAKKYANQIGCKGYHEYQYNGLKTYMACENVEPLVNQPQTTLPCSEYIEGTTDSGIIIWSSITELTTQHICCSEMTSDGYVWDDLTRKCYIPIETDNTTVGNHSVLGFIENTPVWYTNGAAAEYADIIGCSGTHTHTINGRTGFMACEDHASSQSNLSPLCFDTETTIDGSLVFNNTNTINNSITHKACCQQWREYSFMWDGSGCSPLEFSLTWDCIDNVVTEVFGGSGYYQNFDDALSYCDTSSSQNLTYDCVNQRCEVNPVNNGLYTGPHALNNCLDKCAECIDQKTCCDTTASNCDSLCETAFTHNSCGCDNNYCIYDHPNVVEPVVDPDEPQIDSQVPVLQPGCDDGICLHFNQDLILGGLAVNTNLPGIGIWRQHTCSFVPNFWSNSQIMHGVFNIFALPGSEEFLELYDETGILLGTVPHADNNAIMPVFGYTYRLYYFTSGVLTEITEPFLTIPTAPWMNTLTPNTYVIKVTDGNNTGINGNLCVHTFSFTINNEYAFIPNQNIGGPMCQIWGCTEADAVNYQPTATANNSTCQYLQAPNPINGCTDFVACNYDATATVDDGSCDYSCYGCTDDTALNFNTNATIACNGNFGNFCQTPGPSNCCCEYQPAVYGCTDIYAQNYDPSADTDDGSCDYIIYGCSNPLADNFDPAVVIDDGSCMIPGCTDDGTDMGFPGRPNGYLGTASNYDINATVNNGSCIYVDCEYGCTDPTSTNYDVDATCDDGSCYGGGCGNDGTSGGTSSYIITGITDSKLGQILWPGYPNADSILEATTDPDMIDKYGVNPYYPLIKRVPSKGMDDGWTVINDYLFTAYTINNIHYWDYSTVSRPHPIGRNVITRFAVQMTNCCPGCLYPDIKEEWTLGHVFPPQIENNVFIDRGQISIFEDFYRITEVNKLEDFDNYQGGFFNIIS